MANKSWTFRVQYDPDNVGIICVSGDCETLGNWCPNNLLRLKLDKATNSWIGSADIPTDRDVHYRYVLCTFINSSPPKTMIHYWETNLQSRIIQSTSVFKESETKVDVFGLSENTKKIENGWLTSDVFVQLSVNRDAIQWQSPNYQNKKVNIKLSSALPCDINTGAGCSEVLLSVCEENGRLCKQEENGYAYYKSDSTIFITRAFSIDKLGFKIEFVDLEESEVKKYYSFAVLENKNQNSHGSFTIPIHSEQREYLGTLSVKYLIIRPTADLSCKFKVSYAKYWNNSWTGLEIGHRGSGVSYSKVKEKNAKFRENTIGSFKSAGQCGAHLIEFDVQLTNDLVPTIYHDFHVLLDVRKKEQMDQNSRKMVFPFHKLRYEELKDFKVHHVNESNLTFSFENDDQEEYSPFPSLEQVLQAIDPQIGFNIEIKYNSELMDGSNELDHPIDMNEYVDRILKVVYANAGRRYIVFSSFNPDVCLMARMKQNKYPVMFLTQGQTKKYPPYSDHRMSNVENAVKFANYADLLGIVAHSEELLVNYSHVKYVLNNNLVLFCWGDDNNDEKNICTLREQGVHGIIFDRIDQYGQKLKKDVFQNVVVN
ncbi:glycerophosphocholine phosphodiesterase GPCPD1-like [Planococcus citri]|uniref:glycerophosphocholine phosphodiesterase GPCPD1-like n=1 Tax=Planococcus citri TaxID=170843 RepID=UPI0031F9E7FD